MTATDAPPTNLLTTLHHYLNACQHETHTARQARNRETLTLYEAGVPVSQLADIMGVSERAVYKLMDSAKDKGD